MREEEYNDIGAHNLDDKFNKAATLLATWNIDKRDREEGGST